MERNETIKFLQAKFLEHRDQLILMKANAQAWGGYADWPWNGLVLSAATRGGSARWDRNVKLRYDSELSWQSLEGISDEERKKRFETVGRFWRRTANWLERVYQHILEQGGPASIRRTLDPMDATQIIAFWKQFPEIGDKYARNIMMDIYDHRFRDGCFAIDSRIKKLLPLLGYQGTNHYEEQEVFLAILAAEITIEGWEIDRLLYRENKQIAKALA
ncbi:MAG: hypothetical protein ABF623_12655 [Gluconobacter cerinus]|uniref:hypothetical protein n=1 Tax=Gluconobacter cerinus TaxID=38307 RepID=UPI0039E9ACB8